jgi:hypothetical protein
VDVGLGGRRGAAGVDHDQPGSVGTVQPVQHPHPQHRLGLGHVVADQEQGVGLVDIGVGGGLAVAAETLLEGLGGGGRAQPGVAVQVRAGQAGLHQDAEGVVLLQEQLAAVVDPDPPAAVTGQQLLGPLHQQAHGRVPIRGDQVPVPADQRPGEPIGRVVGLPAEQPLGPEPTLVHPVRGPPPHPYHAAVPDRDIQPAAVGTQHTGRLHPPIHVLLRDPIAQRLVDAHRPGTAGCKRGSLPPRIRDPIHHRRRPPPTSPHWLPRPGCIPPRDPNNQSLPGSHVAGRLLARSARTRRQGRSRGLANGDPTDVTLEAASCRAVPGRPHARARRAAAGRQRPGPPR